MAGLMTEEQWAAIPNEKKDYRELPIAAPIRAEARPEFDRDIKRIVGALFWLEGREPWWVTSIDGQVVRQTWERI